MSYNRKKTGKFSREARGRYCETQTLSSHKKHKPVFAVVMLDILLAGVILLTFALFHHALPAFLNDYRRANATEPAPSETVAQTVPDITPETASPTQSAVAPTEDSTVPPTTEPDNRTPWQIKFEEHFSDEVILTENSYKSPEVSIEIETFGTEIDGEPIVYYVADIYVASIDNFSAAVANNDMSYYSRQNAEKLDRNAKAIISICGDFLTYQKNGYIVRNSETYLENSNLYSICALYPDGTMEMFDGRAYDIADIKAKNPLQVWSFGPVLLDEEGHVRSNYDVSSTVAQKNPRSAIGYYEPGHYCFVVVDGRQKHSIGIRIPDLAAIFEELGCSAAYNLDGGGSAVMFFNHDQFSRPSNGGDRKLGDLLVIRDSYFDAETEEAGK